MTAPRTRSAVRAVAVLGAAALGTAALALVPGGARPAAAAGLVPYGSCEELLAHHRERLVEAATPWGFDGSGGAGIAVPATAAQESTDSAAGSTVAGSGGEARTSAVAGDAVGRGGTGTNLQEQGVDEPDWAKLRDGHLVVLSGSRLNVVTASATPTVVSSLPLGDGTHGGELLLDGDRALVVQQGWREERGPSPLAGQSRLAWHPSGSPTTTLRLVDLADPSSPRVLETAELDGRYVSARLAGGSVRLVTASTPQPPVTYPQAPATEDEALAANRQAARALALDDVLPQVRRTGPGGEVLQDGPLLACGGVARTADGAGSSTLVVTTLQPARSLAALDTTGVTAHGDLVYASVDRLYVGTSRWGTTGPVPVEPDADPQVAAAEDQVTTQLHAFDTTHPARSTYVGTGEVPGYVYGRWALSEHEGALRVATTRQPPWGGDGASSSSVFVLAEREGALVQTGRVDGLGVTEQIKAVRWFGDTAAVVTFRQTDPLYLLDLSDETAPRVTGELKVPGFSTYLHPLGDGLLLGLGHDATDQGQVTGVQLSTFDVRDPAAPRQVDRLSLGGGWSTALDDSRAFGYDPGRRLATLPFSTWTEDGGTSAALGVRVSEDGALSEAGRLAVHPSTPTERVLADDELLFSVSPRGVAAGRVADLVRTGAVALETGHEGDHGALEPAVVVD